MLFHGIDNAVFFIVLTENNGIFLAKICVVGMRIAVPHDGNVLSVTQILHIIIELHVVVFNGVSAHQFKSVGQIVPENIVDNFVFYRVGYQFPIRMSKNCHTARLFYLTEPPDTISYSERTAERL